MTLFLYLNKSGEISAIYSGHAAVYNEGNRQKGSLKGKKPTNTQINYT
jgi:hypothetical protein